MDKEDSLRKANVFNKNSDKVTADYFSPETFLDPRDLLQTRYEAVRTLEVDKKPVKEVAELFGFSEKRIRDFRASMETDGLLGLVPKKRGPSSPHKLKDEGRQFVDDYLRDHPHASGREINEALSASGKGNVCKRTVERYISKK